MKDKFCSWLAETDQKLANLAIEIFYNCKDWFLMLTFESLVLVFPSSNILSLTTPLYSSVLIYCLSIWNKNCYIEIYDIIS